MTSKEEKNTVKIEIIKNDKRTDNKIKEGRINTIQKWKKQMKQGRNKINIY